MEQFQPVIDRLVSGLGVERGRRRRDTASVEENSDAPSAGGGS